jgi:fluoroacetyl-CoA thioesterase
MVRKMAMKESLRPGMSRISRIEVDRDRTIGFMGEEDRVYAAPGLVQDIENTCRDLILEHADSNEDSVGIGVSIRHLATTLPGMTVEITATVSAVEGSKVTFAIAANDNLEPIYTGSHIRFVVEKTKTLERLKAKVAKYTASG